MSKCSNLKQITTLPCNLVPNTTHINNTFVKHMFQLNAIALNGVAQVFKPTKTYEFPTLSILNQRKLVISSTEHPKARGSHSIAISTKSSRFLLGLMDLHDIKGDMFYPRHKKCMDYFTFIRWKMATWTRGNVAKYSLYMEHLGMEHVF